MSLVRDHLLSDTAPRHVGDYGELGLDAYNILGIAARYGCDLWVLTDRQWWLVRRMTVVEQMPIRRRHGRREYTEALASILMIPCSLAVLCATPRHLSLPCTA
jgi:hypothetical protein